MLGACSHVIVLSLVLWNVGCSSSGILLLSGSCCLNIICHAVISLTCHGADLAQMRKYLKQGHTALGSVKAGRTMLTDNGVVQTPLFEIIPQFEQMIAELQRPGGRFQKKGIDVSAPFYLQFHPSWKLYVSYVDTFSGGTEGLVGIVCKFEKRKMTVLE